MATYSRTEVLQFKNGESIVHFPDLTDEERTRRHQQLKAAASRGGQEHRKCKRQVGQLLLYVAGFCGIHRLEEIRRRVWKIVLQTFCRKKGTP